MIWQGKLPRPTRDVDLLGYGSANTKDVIKAIREICSAQSDDGLVFDLDSIRIEETREEADYDGVRVLVEATLDKARVTMQIDIGYGDAVDPAPVQTSFPIMLDLPAPSLRAYPAEVVIAEKLQAMIHLGIANTRMKDFFDIWTLSREQTFLMSRLRRAIVATFARRKTSLPEGAPTALTQEFLGDPGKVGLWRGFLKRMQLLDSHVELADVGATITDFLLPVIEAVRVENNEEAEWSPKGAWTKL